MLWCAHLKVGDRKSAATSMSSESLSCDELEKTTEVLDETKVTGRSSESTFCDELDKTAEVVDAPMEVIRLADKLLIRIERELGTLGDDNKWLTPTVADVLKRADELLEKFEDEQSDQAEEHEMEQTILASSASQQNPCTPLQPSFLESFNATLTLEENGVGKENNCDEYMDEHSRELDDHVVSAVEDLSVFSPTLSPQKKVSRKNVFGRSAGRKPKGNHVERQGGGSDDSRETDDGNETVVIEQITPIKAELGTARGSRYDQNYANTITRSLMSPSYEDSPILFSASSIKKDKQEGKTLSPMKSIHFGVGKVIGDSYAKDEVAGASSWLDDEDCSHGDPSTAPMKVRVSVLKDSRSRRANALNVHQLHGGNKRGPDDRIKRLERHQHTALIWMLLREGRLEIARHVSDSTLGSSYYKAEPPNSFQSVLRGGIFCDAPGLKKASTLAAMLSVTIAHATKPTLVITTDARLTLWHETLAGVPNLKAHFYTGKKTQRIRHVCALLDPRNYFDQYDVVVSTYKIISCNEVDPKRAVRKSAWIKRAGPEKHGEKPGVGVTYLHLGTYDRVVLDEARSIGTTANKKFEKVNKLSGHFRWCLSDNTPTTPRRLCAWLSFLSGGTPLSIASIAAIAAAKGVREGSKWPSVNTIILRRTKEDIVTD